MEIQLSKNKSIYLFSKVSLLDISLSMKHLGVMLKSGLGIEESVEIVAKQSNDKRLQKAYAGILEGIRSGKTMAESMRKYDKIFSNIVISIIEVGEEGATLEKNLAFLASYLKKDYELQKKIKGAMFYPIIVLGLTVVELLGVVYFILPKLEDLFLGFDNIPRFTILVLNGARFFRTNMPFIVGGLILFIITITQLLKTEQGKIFKQRLALRFPMVACVIANPLSKGIPLDNNAPKVQEELKTGKNISASMEQYSKYFPITYIKLIEVGEQTGTLEENLKYLHELYSEEVEDMTDNMATIIEPLLLIFIGLMIGALALLIVAPIYQLTGSINE